MRVKIADENIVDARVEMGLAMRIRNRDGRKIEIDYKRRVGTEGVENRSGMRIDPRVQSRVGKSIGARIGKEVEKK